ncbi:MAG TPA: fluoride efflux transporter CrcB [Steroidobacteraceae bacterium]|nr:fluoride efflux transporter CrcB [Steroidobacteraceae bacterium]
MTGLAVIAVGVGAALGAWLRWGLAALLNTGRVAVPLGTLAANWIGAYVIGVAIAFFSQTPTISAEWRLFVITGFCGGLTTFSTFSAESSLFLEQGRFGALAAEIALHVAGSLVLTVFGMVSWRWLATR